MTENRTLLDICILRFTVSYSYYNKENVLHNGIVTFVLFHIGINGRKIVFTMMFTYFFSLAYLILYILTGFLLLLWPIHKMRWL